MPNLDPATSQFDSAARSLRQRWEDTKAVWNDPVRWSFEREYWAPLAQEAEATLKEMERLAQVIAQARRNVT